jgi:glycosyltransferase involved in cell wall biosynthesis
MEKEPDMLPSEHGRVGYVLKRYPRYSETFIVNEILAHEAAGLSVEIFSLYPPNDDHFQDLISQVKAPVTYLTASGLKAADFWTALEEAGSTMPGVWAALEQARGEDVRSIYQALLLARAVQSRGIVHLHAHFANIATTVARLASRFASVPYSFTAHAKDIFHESVSLPDLGRKLVDARGVVTVSDYNLTYLRDTFGTLAQGVRRIYNGLDLDRFVYDSPEDRAPIVLGVGRLVEKKGFSDLIEACAHLASRGIDFRCRIIGTGELEADLQAQVARLGLADRVELVGPQPQAEVARELSKAAVFAAPCVIGEDGNRDGLPTVLLEAMAVGTPCISTAVTGIPEVLYHQQTGIIVPQHDPAALAEAIQQLLHDRELRCAMARNARQVIEERFDIRRNAAHVRRLFEVEQPVELEALGRAM